MLYSDSLVAWYPSKDSDREDAEGGVRVSSSPDLVAGGQYASGVPGKPSLPPGCGIKQVIALGYRGREVVTKRIYRITTGPAQVGLRGKSWV